MKLQVRRCAMIVKEVVHLAEHVFANFWFGATAKLQNRVKWIESSAFLATAAATTHRPLILILEIVSFEKLGCADPS
jgi:hypothetical protein